MSSLYTEDFEGSFPGVWTKTGTQQSLSTQDTSVFSGGAASFKVDTTGASGTSYLLRTPTAGRMIVMRYYFRLDTAPGGISNLQKLANTSAALQMSINTSRVIRMGTSGTVQSGPTLTIGQWYRIDARFDSSGATATIDWQVDGVAQTQYTVAQTAADFTTHQFGETTSQTVALHFDDIAADDNSASYPLGAVGGGMILTATGTTLLTPA